MSFDDEERTERVLFSVPYRATSAEARAIYAPLLDRPEWLEWSIADDLLKGTFDATSEAAEQLARRATTNYLKLAKLTVEAVSRMEAER